MRWRTRALCLGTSSRHVRKCCKRLGASCLVDCRVSCRAAWPFTTQQQPIDACCLPSHMWMAQVPIPSCSWWQLPCSKLCRRKQSAEQGYVTSLAREHCALPGARVVFVSCKSPCPPFEEDTIARARRLGSCSDLQLLVVWDMRCSLVMILCGQESYLATS